MIKSMEMNIKVKTKLNNKSYLSENVTNVNNCASNRTLASLFSRITDFAFVKHSHFSFK